jgi:50S ribosomal protein L16 3-hydroxylase
VEADWQNWQRPNMLHNESADRFLAKYWQKALQFMPAAAESGLPQLSGDEIAWLATQADVESRLVFTERVQGATTYRLENGPFDESRLAALPPREWTLLVNDVDKHLPDFRAYLNLVDFIPDWRIDDLMVSFAAPGGGVGPHFDNYDVFLVQGHGTREWRIGDPGAAEPDEESDALSLLKPFEVEECFVANQGDILYLPPSIPHWGIAKSMCTTYSIGMRAPTMEELRLAEARCFENDTGASRRGGFLFYADPDLQADEASAGMIDQRALQRLRAQSMVDDARSAMDIATILGCAVTDPKAWLAPESVIGAEATTLIEFGGDLRVHGMARIAWFRAREDALVFVNGVGRRAGLEDLEVIAEVCRRRQLGYDDKRRLLRTTGGPELLRWLLSEGLFDAADVAE